MVENTDSMASQYVRETEETNTGNHGMKPFLTTAGTGDAIMPGFLTAAAFLTEYPLCSFKDCVLHLGQLCSSEKALRIEPIALGGPDRMEITNFLSRKSSQSDEFDSANIGS